MEQHLNFETLFRPANFEKYLNAQQKSSKQWEAYERQRDKRCPKCEAQMIGTLCISCGYEEKP